MKSRLKGRYMELYILLFVEFLLEMGIKYYLFLPNNSGGVFPFNFLKK